MYSTELNNPPKPYLKESYSNGSSWYRIYSDGWCEQGGLDSVPTGGHTCNLLKNFKDNTYNVSANSMSNAYFACITSRYTSGFQLASFTGSQGYGSSVLWRASGYVE